MKRIAVALLFLAPLVASAHADDASKTAKVKELLTLLHIDQVQTQVEGNVNRQLQTLSTRQLGSTLTAEQQKQFGEMQAHVDGLVQQTLDWKTVGPDYVKLYSDTYTEPEIDSVLAFYKSPAGQTWLTKSPELSTKTQTLTQQRMAAIEPQVRQTFTDFVKQATPATPAAAPTLKTLPPVTAPPAASPAPATNAPPK